MSESPIESENVEEVLREEGCILAHELATKQGLSEEQKKELEMKIKAAMKGNLTVFLRWSRIQVARLQIGISSMRDYVKEIELENKILRKQLEIAQLRLRELETCEAIRKEAARATEEWLNTVE